MTVSLEVMQDDEDDVYYQDQDWDHERMCASIGEQLLHNTSHVMYTLVEVRTIRSQDNGFSNHVS